MSEAPPFWFKPPGLAAFLLSPFGKLYGSVAARRMNLPARSHIDVPVLCIGNFIAGGAGKTPTAIALAKLARDMGLRPGFLSRGYGGSVSKPTVVDLNSHNAHDVGDEALILVQYAVSVVSPDRPAGARLLIDEGVDFIIMDDGFQNPSLHKDYTLAVIDAGRGLGNGYCIPAGPVRATLEVQLAHASAILLIGQSEAGTAIVRQAAKAAKPVLNARMVSRNGVGWTGRKVLAFAAIGDPTKFFASLAKAGAELVERRSFHDHHPFTQEECRDLMAKADREGLTLVTTEKDAKRLMRMGAAQQALLSRSHVLFVDLVFDNAKMAQLVISDTLKRAEANRLARH
ncbi:MAG: tetraacyldisaccharide 4'-kinase [Ahrensia sp.]|nr:tetraacyldisaccharide 4'-kinase [Ahrensia sp.]